MSSYQFSIRLVSIWIALVDCVHKTVTLACLLSSFGLMVSRSFNIDVYIAWPSPCPSACTVKLNKTLKIVNIVLICSVNSRVKTLTWYLVFVRKYVLETREECAHGKF